MAGALVRRASVELAERADVSRDVYDSGGAGSLGWWVALALVLVLGLVWYFTGWPFGPRGR